MFRKVSPSRVLIGLTTWLYSVGKKCLKSWYSWHDIRKLYSSSMTDLQNLHLHSFLSIFTCMYLPISTSSLWLDFLKLAMTRLNLRTFTISRYDSWSYDSLKSAYKQSLELKLISLNQHCKYWSFSHCLNNDSNYLSCGTSCGSHR